MIVAEQVPGCRLPLGYYTEVVMDLEQVFTFTRDLYGADFKDIRGSLTLQSWHLKGGVEDRPEQSSVKAAKT